MGIEDVLLVAAIVVLIAFGWRLAEFGRRLGGGISNRRGGGPGGPSAA